MAMVRDLAGFGADLRRRWSAWFSRVVSVGIVTTDPEVARRQRFTNIACFVAMFNALSHLVINGFYDFRGMIPVNVYNLIVSVVYLLLPRLHRYGNNVAAIALTTVVLGAHMYVVFAFGLASDLHIYYTLVGATLFLFGVQHWRLFLFFVVMAVGAMQIVLNFAPVNGFVLPADAGLRDMLSRQAMINTIIINAVLIFVALSSLRRAETQLEHEHQRSEGLLAAILPASISARLKDRIEERIADRIDNLSVIFIDQVGFTSASHDMAPDSVVAYLDVFVRDFETLCERYRVDKIKSIGDGLMAAAGLDGDARAGAIAAGNLALAMIEQNGARGPLGERKLGIRIGINCGPAMAGVIGGTRFSFDVWGDAVNVAARMESTGEPNRIQVSDAFRTLAGDAFVYEERGATQIKGIGEAQTYFLLGACGASRT